MNLDWPRKLSSLALAAVLSACGGGGGGSSPPEPTVLPSAVTLTVPATAQADATVNFTSSAAASAGLRHAWDFGDGGTSSQASPTHTYTQAGDFDVKLVVSNEAGQTIEQKTRLSVERTLAYQGRKCSAAEGHGWCWITGDNMLGQVAWQGAQTGWQVGDAGEVWKTADGGLNWAQQANDIRQTIGQLSFADASRGWVLGAAGGYKTELWTTGDGGKSWQSLGAVPSVGDLFSARATPALSWRGTDKLLADSYYMPGITSYRMAQHSSDGGAHWSSVSVNTGVAAPGGKRWRFETLRYVSSSYSVPNGPLQSSDDGGLTWSTVLPFEEDRQGRILVPDASVVLVLSWRGSLGSVSDRRIHLSRDGGATWTTPPTPANFDIDVIAYRVGGPSPAGLAWLQDGATLYRSKDFGSTWQAVAWPPLGEPGGGPLSVDGGSAYWLTMLMGGQWISFDNGDTWSEMAKLDIQTGNSVSQLHQAGPELLVADGTQGGVYVSTDRGKTWRATQAPRIQKTVLGFHAFNAKELLRADDAPSSNTNAMGLWRSSDGGANWQKVYAGAGPLEFASAKTGWMCGSNGSAGLTRDGGQTWTVIGEVPGCFIAFAGDSHGWIYGGFGYEPSVLKESKDGGVSWVDVGSVPGASAVRALRALSDSELLVLRATGVWLSTDAGKTWRETLHGEQANFTALLRAGARDVWATGAADQVWHSTDGGATWARVTLPVSAGAAIKAGHFLDAQRGWLDSGRPGELLRTVDGGKTWTVQRTGSSMGITGLQFTDAKTGWFWGPHGLLATGSGGQ